MNKLFFEVESDYLELKDRLIDYDSILTLKEFLDIGFNNSYIYLKVEDNGVACLRRFNIGYRNCEKCVKCGYKLYESKDFSLNEKQLSCKVRMVDSYTDSDNYTIISIALQNKSDLKYFINSKGVCK